MGRQYVSIWGVNWYWLFANSNIFFKVYLLSTIFLSVWNTHCKLFLFPPIVFLQHSREATCSREWLQP